ncbi:MAG: LuxR C-terminal-related transcriptional regulator [Cytophagaceae bacterium]|jgi:DNA-binding CsgD family transcriptional regulator|nr:LuxR C-terminal-related transcriptional regulator [Cytophagaceae bacterium]
MEEVYQEYERVLASQIFQQELLNYEVLSTHLAKLTWMESVSASSYSVFDMNKREHIYLSQNFARTFGYDLHAAATQGNAYLDSRVHPEDLAASAMAGTFFLKFALQIPPPERLKYKFIGEYRILKSDGSMMRVIEQHQVLELDAQGNIWLVLGVMDASPDQDLAAWYRCRLQNFHTGEFQELPHDFFLKLRAAPTLSGREREVLSLLSSGLLSKEIADKLFISVHTVNTHRQKILEKLQVDTTVEALSLARRVGIL